MATDDTHDTPAPLRQQIGEEELAAVTGGAVLPDLDGWTDNGLNSTGLDGIPGPLTGPGGGSDTVTAGGTGGIGQSGGPGDTSPTGG